MVYRHFVLPAAIAIWMIEAILPERRMQFLSELRWEG